jgi:hypothetical protein
MNRKIKSGQRKAYGKICLQAFSIMQSLANGMLDWSKYFPDALSDTEREYATKMKTRINKDADIVRAFGWKVCND